MWDAATSPKSPICVCVQEELPVVIIKTVYTGKNIQIIKIWMKYLKGRN